MHSGPGPRDALLHDSGHLDDERNSAAHAGLVKTRFVNELIDDCSHLPELVVASCAHNDVMYDARQVLDDAVEVSRDGTLDRAIDARQAHPLAQNLGADAERRHDAVEVDGQKSAARRRASIESMLDEDCGPDAQKGARVSDDFEGKVCFGRVELRPRWQHAQGCIPSGWGFAQRLLPSSEGARRRYDVDPPRAGAVFVHLRKLLGWVGEGAWGSPRGREGEGEGGYKLSREKE